MLQQQQEIKENYEKEILKTQIEIRDQVMNDVGRELHDHISQIMTLIKLNLNMLDSKGLDMVNEKRLADAKELIKETINDIRQLSKTLNGELVLHIGLEESIKHELERINRLNIIKCYLEVEGEEYTIQPNTAFIVFRIIQENLHNILKHAHCTTVRTKLIYNPDSIILSQQDNGVGFNPENSNGNQGSGLLNMKRRAAMINSQLNFESESDKGTVLTLKINRHN